ncbi:MAG TPA: orotidine-5'-phosphate decarboxylase [Acidobacteriota bacterium]|jgi:orotidine-5'-phosphate decarboxylase
MEDRLIIALDVASGRQALDLAEKLSPVTRRFKIGSYLFTLEGPALIRQMRERDYQVFLDLKFHDIPDVVAGAVRNACDLGVSMLTIHAAGGLEMMKTAITVIRSLPEHDRPLLLAVTVLTSFSVSQWQQTFPHDSLPQAATRLALLARDAGLPGLVCSPKELAQLRHVDMKKIVPGVRPARSGPDDQQRTMTPAGAIAAGADYLVIGRPITRAADPILAVRAIAKEMS